MGPVQKVREEGIIKRVSNKVFGNKYWKGYSSGWNSNSAPITQPKVPLPLDLRGATEKPLSP